jgi:hypothetical protein
MTGYLRMLPVIANENGPASRRFGNSAVKEPVPAAVAKVPVPPVTV